MHWQLRFSSKHVMAIRIRQRAGCQLLGQGMMSLEYNPTSALQDCASCLNKAEVFVSDCIGSPVGQFSALTVTQ